MSKLINVREKELVMLFSYYHRQTFIHNISTNENNKLEIILELINIGWRELIMYKNQFANNPLHFLC